jgi:hypothetical protein
MTTYDLMIKTNDYLLGGGCLSDGQKRKIVDQYMESICDPEKVSRFHRSVNAPSASNGDSRQMYPVYYIPPFNNGYKLKTVTNVIPKTHILAANSYELEIIRQLYLLADHDPKVDEMVKRTVQRLRNTCFGNFCAVGECFETSIIALRFIITVAPDEKEWIQKLIDDINDHMDEKKRHNGTKQYYEICLDELNQKEDSENENA